MKAGSNANVRTPWANEDKGAANVPVQETKKKASKKTTLVAWWVITGYLVSEDNPVTVHNFIPRRDDDHYPQYQHIIQPT